MPVQWSVVVTDTAVAVETSVLPSFDPERGFEHHCFGVTASQKFQGAFAVVAGTVGKPECDAPAIKVAFAQDFENRPNGE
jgi:hypothetical protein